MNTVRRATLPPSCQALLLFSYRGLLLFCGLWILGCQEPPATSAVPAVQPKATELKVESFDGLTMGTSYSVLYVDPSCDAGPPTFKAYVTARLIEINARMSTYDPESELSRFNQYEQAEWFAVSAETATVVAFAIQLAAETDGAYDPTIGPVVNLWGFGPDRRRPSLPTDEAIAMALKRVDYRAVEVRADPPALRKQRPDIYLDLSSIAKGYASDAIGELLAAQGVTNYMVEIGGEVATQGKKPDGSPWRIGLEEPDPSNRTYEKVVELSGDAIATSGDYRNFFQRHGVRYSHTIDPTTGHPVKHDLATVTVRAASCIKADAWATAMLVMGPERGYNWAERRGIAALLIRRGEDGSQEQATSNWSTEP